ncbi:a0666294-854c-48b1-a5ab-3a6c7c7f3e10 [Thermothielavioides terrestris]|uniref:A0666294-854c-48b1-a5ab-3a6c7c7f3e10 n=1 Tax=Thermothielavioides terrestris TaxID=2587410 RepID=A0A446BQD9_9PEZI|nr:a0666294-854c-48b1-a5ab-3a6c7c7f3e10 [Thermothielavioides terrestris]
MSQKAAGRASARERNPLELPEGINKRCDLPPEAYWHADRVNTPYARRTNYNTSGDDIRVGVNQFRIQSVAGRDVYQYDVSITPEPKGSIVYKKAWQTKVVQGKLAQLPNPWLYDGRKLAWSTNNVPGLKCEVDLGADEGRPGRKNNTFTIEIKQTCKVRMEALKAYLTKQMGWDNTVLECMSFLDHVLRQGPSERMHLVKRTLFNEYSQTKRLNSCTEAIKGIYSAVRLNESINSGGLGLGVNVDVANQTFWVGQRFEQLARNFLSCMNRKWATIDYDGMRQALLPVKIEVKGGGTTWGMSEAFKALRRLQNIRFEVKHRGNSQGPKEYKVRRLAFDPKYGETGACAKAVTFDKKMPDGSTKTYSVFQYYLEQYKARIQHWYLPLIETTKAGYFPMEVCEVLRFNPYPFKLDPAQTQEMIKFAVQRPQQRKAEIMQMVQNLEWDKDRYLAHFGIKINPIMPMVPAKVLRNPVVQFANRSTDPKMTGRWDLRGMKFVLPNKKPLVSWAFVIVDACVDKPTMENFAKVFKTTYAAHGGVISRDPRILMPPVGTGHDKIVEGAFNQCGNENKATPQIIFFVLRDKTSWVYDRLKKNADCRFACLTQMLQAQHVRKAQGQYCSNVCMKVNSKLGGQTSRIAHQGQGSAFFKVPTMMIGLDISHGNTASGSVSVAAMCVSMDKDAAVYDAAVQTNGRGVEILQPEHMHSMLGPLAVKWRQKNQVAPQHVFYLRDGVSEGQFAHVMEFEVGEMRKVFKEHIGGVPKITVIIATKRHHIRFFPERGDKNGNCLPGTLVEREVTHPFHYDFYLCSHVAIQGTARPVHYNVLQDECGLKADDLQRILYHQCYQYCRSTTPVSLHPAVYYAHLAGARARHHEDMATSDQVPKESKYLVLRRPGPMAKREGSETSSQDEETQPPKLLKPGSYGGRADAIETFTNTMWWV